MLDPGEIAVVLWTTFAKAWGPAGLELPPARHEPSDRCEEERDHAARSGTGAYLAFQAQLAHEPRRGTEPRDLHGVIDYAVHLGAPDDLTAVKWAERFLRDLRRYREGRRG